MTRAAAEAIAWQLSASKRRSARVKPTWNSKLACQRPSVGPLTLTIATTGAGAAPARARLFSTWACTCSAVGHSAGARQITTIGFVWAAAQRAPPSDIINATIRDAMAGLLTVAST
jgi:hypothetical protein